MDYINNIYWAYRNKITNKLWGIVSMPATGKKKGSVLISYFTEPFTLAPWEPFSNFHTMYWECYEIARLFSQRGYAIDIVDAKREIFVPKKPYVVCIDTENNLDRLFKYLPKNCKKVLHILISHWDAYNEAEKNRLEALYNRRGFRLTPRRRVDPSRNAEVADFLEGFGNKTVFKTFEKFHKPIYFIPISTVLTFDFPENKDFEKAQRHFLWIGGGGMVLKGLDITLEAFSKLSNLHLHICGPVFAEQDFVNAYKKELFKTPNIHTYGRINIASKEFSEILNKCSAIIYPSAGEGSSGAIVQAMHAGLVPITTHETGIQEDAEYIPLINPTPESVAQAVKEFSTTPSEKIKERARAIWKYARTHYTREEFSKAYARFIDEILKL